MIVHLSLICKQRYTIIPSVLLSTSGDNKSSNLCNYHILSTLPVHTIQTVCNWCCMCIGGFKGGKGVVPPNVTFAPGVS